MNLTGCIPKDENHNKRDEGPNATEIMCCSQRLREILELCKPRLIVCVGDLSNTWLDQTRKLNIWVKHKVEPNKDGVLTPKVVTVKGKGPVVLSKMYEIPRVHLMHPAFILRQSIVNRGLLWQRCQLALEAAIMDHVTNVPLLPDGQSPF